MANDVANESSIKLKQDMQFDELKVLNSLENWGASLFLGAIGLISKQILDWSNPVAALPCKYLSLHWPIFLLPAVIGLVAFIYLRCVNYRIRDLRGELYAKTQPAKGDGNRCSLGSVGWLTALMPLAFGYAVSWYFSIDNLEVVEPFRNMVWLGITFLGVAVAVFICKGKCCHKSSEP